MENNQHWFVLQVYANSENAVKNTIMAQQAHGFYENIKEIFVPVEQITSISPKGKKSLLNKALYSGYIYLLIENYDDKKMSSLTKLSKISKFVGQISEKEINLLKEKVKSQEGKTKYRISYVKGDKIRVKAGTFNNFKGEVVEFMPDKNMVKLNVFILGRKTDVTLDIQHIEMYEGEDFDVNEK